MLAPNRFNKTGQQLVVLIKTSFIIIKPKLLLIKKIIELVIGLLAMIVNADLCKYNDKLDLKPNATIFILII